MCAKLTIIAFGGDAWAEGDNWAEQAAWPSTAASWPTAAGKHGAVHSNDQFGSQFHIDHLP